MVLTPITYPRVVINNTELPAKILTQIGQRFRVNNARPTSHEIVDDLMRFPNIQSEYFARVRCSILGTISWYRAKPAINATAFLLSHFIVISRELLR